MGDRNNHETVWQLMSRVLDGSGCQDEPTQPIEKVPSSFQTSVYTGDVLTLEGDRHNILYP